MKAEVDKKRPLLFAIDEDGQWLMSNLYTTDKAGKRKSTASEVQQNLAEITNHIHHLTEELNKKRSHINALLSDELSFEETEQKIKGWLKDTEKTLATQKPLSVDPDELKKQALQHQV